MSYLRKGLFDTIPLESKNGYTYTLTSRISDMLFKAESLFGARDRSWTILGVEIYINGVAPQIWYPKGLERRHIIFQLVSPAHINEVVANYQLAHEVIHSLSPVIGVASNVLEEGIASWFAMDYVRKEFDVIIKESLESYRTAREKVERLLAVDDNAIKKLRLVEPCFKRMRIDTFEKAGLAVDKVLIGELLSSFER